MHKKRSKVLFITSYSSYVTNFDNLITGIKEGLGEDTSLHIKYLDYNSTENINNKNNYYKNIKSMVENENYDAIIVGDYYILEFVLNYRYNIFNSIPIVFFGTLSEDIINQAMKYENITGIKERNRLVQL